MGAGKYDVRGTLQQNTPTKDSEGIAADGWYDIATVWASVRGLRGREFFQAAAVNAESTIIVTIRHRFGVTPKMRFQYTRDGKTYTLDITSVVPVGRNRELELVCKEVV